MARFKVVMTDDRHKTYEDERKILEAIDAELVIANCTTPEEVIEACKDADGIMANLAPMNKDVINSLEKCKVIARYGVGYDNVDVEAATAKGIYVTNVTDYCFEEVSDHALALLLSCTRKTARRDAQVRDGMWNVGGKDPIYRMTGKVFGFLGFGMIAKTMNRKIKGFNFSKVLVYDPFVDAKTIEGEGCIKAEWDEVFKESDYISVHMPLNDKTRGIIDKDAFAMMKPDGIIVNTSRGPVIDEEALIDALSTGKINSAGLDVHVNEPINMDNPLLKLENCVLTDHVGWYSEEAMIELKQKVAINVKDVLLGGKPKYPVNKI